MRKWMDKGGAKAVRGHPGPTRGNNFSISRLFIKTGLSRFLDFSEWRPLPSWILNFKFVTVRTVKRVELHHHTKFCRNRSNCDRDMAIFWFFQDGGRPPSWISDVCVGTTYEWHLVVFITVQNVVIIDAVVLIICTFFDFTSLASKRLFTPKIGSFLGWGLPPKWGAMWTNPKKAHPCASPRRLSHHAWKSVDWSDL